MVLSDDYTFQLDTSGVLLNGDDQTLPWVDIDRVGGLDSAPYRETVRDHEGMDGSYVDAEFEQGRSIVLEGTVYCDGGNEETFLDDIKQNYAPVSIPIPFYFKAPGVSERLLFVKPLGVRYDWNQIRRIGMSKIQFLMYAEDPRIYDTTQMTTTIIFGDPVTTGIGFDLGFNLDFGTAGVPSGATVTNNGNRPTPAVITITGPVISPRVTNETDSMELNFDITLGASETLAIDLGNHTVTYNGTANRRGSLINPNWWLFNPGNTFVTYSGSSGSGSQAVIVLRSAWR